MTSLDRINAYRLRVPLKVPYRLVFGTVETYDTVIVELTDSDGRSGFGEATILTGYTDETIADCWAATRGLVVECPRHEAALRTRIAEMGAALPFTATAFGTALEMLRGSPLLQLNADAQVPLVGLLNAKDRPAIDMECEQLLAAGYRTIKVKVGFDLQHDIGMVKAVQQVLAGRAAIRLDANQAFSAEQGVAFARALDPAGIELFEQPCAAGDWDSHMAVVRAAGVPMMLDESIYGLPDIERAAQLGAASYIKLKLMKLVTLDALAAALERIRALGMKAVLGNGVACDVGCWMEACIAARLIDNAGEMNGHLKARTLLMLGGPTFERGAMQLSAQARPTLDAEALASVCVDQLVAAPGRV